MPSQLLAYRVFIGSPGGLTDERMRFRDVINEYNETDAIENGLLFIPIAWELTLRGMGRPQQLINEDLSRSGYCVFLLHDRWGSPTSDSAQYLFFETYSELSQFEKVIRRHLAAWTRKHRHARNHTR